MPSIMGAFDTYLTQKRVEHFETETLKTSTPKRSHQLNNFVHLSPCVQKILSHVPEQEVSKKFSSEETLGPKRSRFAYRSLRSSEKINSLNKSNESLDLSPGVHKMLSNLQDSELVISATNLHISINRTFSRNESYLYSRSSEINRSQQSFFNRKPSNNCENSSAEQVDSVSNSEQNVDNSSDVKNSSDHIEKSEECEGYVQVPLGSYLHSEKGIASRTPVGRINMGKYLQVPSESTNTNSTTSSSEVSRPVSLASLASSSSESSSGHHQNGSIYLASAESLDSDPEPAGSQGSADSGIAEQEQTSINPEKRVLQEVLETETVYVADLNEVIKGYLEPWRNDPECPLANYLQDLFSNIEKIYQFNRKILEDLQEANLDPTKTANAFLQHDSGFKVYNEYCANYPRTMEVLSQLQKNDQLAMLFREKQQLLGHALPLGSYLLKPVQRILKYHLLLQRLSKQCEGQHKATVDLALTTMTGVASDINNMKRKHEDAVRVQEIQSQLYGWTGADLTTLGELIAEGTFRVQGARGRRHVFLFEKVLLLAKSKTGGALAYKTHIECSNLMLVEQVRGDPLSFQVLPFDNPRQQCTLRARSHHHKREWTLQIKRVILENYSAAIPSHARQLVMQLGQDLNETDDASERWSPLKYNSTTPHYLERRSRRKTQELTKDRRASSQDRTFPSLGNWRRKSEPSMVPQQYDTKTVPKKISKLKKTKETGSSTFYTDLSDLENCDLAVEPAETGKDEHDGKVKENINSTIENNLEKIVSELLMQNEDFNKVLNRESCRHPRRTINSEPGPIWYEEHRPELPSKADSLPRSFQLNDSSENGGEKDNDGTRQTAIKEEQQIENDLSSRFVDTNYPEHKIYRKSAFRHSLLQRLRTLLSEGQKRNHNHTLHKEANRSTGEKLANPDYEDPQKLFIGSRTTSEVNLNLRNKVVDVDQEQVDKKTTEVIVIVNDKEVLRENGKSSDSSQKENETFRKVSRSSRNSPSDSFYESLLDSSFPDEYVQDKATGKLVIKSDSFNSNDRFSLAPEFPSNLSKKPEKVPPPIPAKPLRLTKQWSHKESVQVSILDINGKEINCDIDDRGEMEQKNNAVQRSWVKAMVDRFE